MADIVVVEDEPGIAENVRYALTRDAHAVRTCADAASGLAAVQTGPCDLVILDVGLPDASGFDVCRSIRTFSAVPVIMLTARGEEIDRVVGLEIGADDYVVKPFSLRELVARVRAILRRPTAIGLPVATGIAPRLALDEARASIRFHGQQLELTRYEYLLLKLLMSTPGRVYSREQIMASLWPDNSGSGDRTVDTHVKSLRAKLKAVAPDDDSIVTHRGFGYSLVAPP